MRFRKSFIVLVAPVIISVIFPPIVSAEYFKLKNPPSEVKLYTYQDKKRYFDSNYGNYDKRANGLVELWTCASTWNGLSKSAIRGIDTRDFEIKADLPPGAKVKCSVDVSFVYGGYVNTASSGSASGYFLVQMDMGFLTAPRFESWNHPVIGKTIYKKSNFRSWYEKVLDLGNQTAQDQLQDIALEPFGEVASLAISAIEQLCEYGSDAWTADLITSGELSGVYNNLWLTVDTQYRTYITLELRSEAEAPSQSITENFSYICFYDHSPVKGKDFRASLPRKGFGITKVELSYYDKDNVVVSDAYACPVIDINTFKAKGNQYRLEAEKPEPFEITFLNRGKLPSSACKAVMESTNEARTVTIDIPPLAAGETWNYEFEHTFKELGDNVFTVTIDPEKVLDKYVDLTIKRTYKFNATYVHVPKYNMFFDKDRIEVCAKYGGETYQTKKPITVKGRIKNEGERECDKATVKLTGALEILESKGTEAEKIAPGESREFYFEFLPLKDKPALWIQAEPKDLELDTKDNTYKIDLGKIEQSRITWCVDEKSFRMVPGYPTENLPVRFEVTIVNNGNAVGEQVKGSVHITNYEKKLDEKLTEFEFTNVPPGGKEVIKDLVWEPKGLGRYAFEVRFEKDESRASMVKRENFKKVFQVGLEMGRVNGVDVMIMDSDISYDEDKEIMYYTLYNRGTEDAYIKLTLYIVYGNGEKYPLFYHQRHEYKLGVKAQSRHSGTLYNVPSGNFRYKLEAEMIEQKGKGTKIDGDMSNNAAWYTCKQYTQDKIGPNLELVGIHLRIVENPWNGSPEAAKGWYIENGKCYALLVALIVANTGNVPCPDTMYECMVLDAAHPDDIPHYKTGSDMSKPQYARGEGKPGKIWTLKSRGYCQPRSGPFGIKDTIVPTTVKNCFFGGYGSMGMSGIEFRAKGDYIFKAIVDPDKTITDDVSPEDNEVTIRFSIPEYIHKLETDRTYYFITMKNLWEGSKKTLEKFNDTKDWTTHPQKKPLIILPASSEYGFE